MAVQINTLFKDKKITKISNGVNIFNAMKAEYNKDNNLSTFILDFQGVDSVSPFVFQEVRRQMQTRLDGQFRVELTNANALVVQSFKLAFSR